jgi:hypothetical protein
MSNCDSSHKPSPGSSRDRDNKFYQFLGGGARIKVLEAFMDLKIPELLGKEGGESIMLAQYTKGITTINLIILQSLSHT